MSNIKTANSGPRAYAVLGLFVLLIVGFGNLFGYVTGGGSGSWFLGLNKPIFNPPSYLFGIVWPILYALMSVAIWRIWRTPSSPERTYAIRIFTVQILMNFAWSFIFFTAHQIAIAAIWIGTLLIAVLLTMRAFRRLDRLAMWLLVPYLAWVSFAFILNASFWVLNPSQSGL